jgi:hypothetical protein
MIRPTRQQALLLTAALAADEESTKAWAQLRSSLDLDTLDPGAVGLLPLVHRQLERLQIDDPLRPRLAGIQRRTWYLNRVRIERLMPVLRALEGSGVQPVLMGSWELPTLYYGDLGTRDVPGLHALIRHDGFGTAAEVLLKLGWRGPTAATAHASRFVGGDGDECVLYRRRFREFPVRDVAAEHEEAGRRSIEVVVQETAARALSTGDELTRLCLDAAPPDLMWVADTVMLLRSAGDLVDWERVTADARRQRAALPLRDACLYLRTEFSVPISDDVLSELGRRPVPRRERLAYRLSAGRARNIVPTTITRFLRATADEHPAPALLGLPSFLRDEWGLARSSKAPLAAMRKLSTRTRSLARRGARGARA